jgi:hypothetical protein
MRKTLLEKVEQYNRGSEPMSRVELWLGVITVYLVISAFVMGHVAAEMGAAQKNEVVAVSNRA